MGQEQERCARARNHANTDITKWKKSRNGGGQNRVTLYFTEGCQGGATGTPWWWVQTAFSVMSAQRRTTTCGHLISNFSENIAPTVGMSTVVDAGTSLVAYGWRTKKRTLVDSGRCLTIVEENIPLDDLKDAKAL